MEYPARLIQSGHWQVRECTTALLHMAKNLKIPIFLVGHVTKSGEVAGPKALEHIVDTTLYMEGEHGQSFRLLRVNKNRFGKTDEVLYCDQLTLSSLAARMCMILPYVYFVIGAPSFNLGLCDTQLALHGSARTIRSFVWGIEPFLRHCWLASQAGCEAFPSVQIGVFSMDESGLQPVPNPSAFFLTDRNKPQGASSAISVTMGGSRPMLVEIQALCTPSQQVVRHTILDMRWTAKTPYNSMCRTTHWLNHKWMYAVQHPGNRGCKATLTVTRFWTSLWISSQVRCVCIWHNQLGQGQGPPVRAQNGVQKARLSQILAILQKYCKLSTYTYHIHTNVVGGFILSEPATDLAVAVAIASSLLDRHVVNNIAFVGEIGKDLKLACTTQYRAEYSAMPSTKLYHWRAFKSAMSHNGASVLYVNTIKLASVCLPCNLGMQGSDMEYYSLLNYIPCNSTS